MRSDSRYEKELKKAYEIIEQQENQKTKEEIVDYLYDNTFLFFPSGEYKKNFLLSVFDRSSQRKHEKQTIFFTFSEINYLKTLEDIKERKMLYCLIAWKKILDEKRDYVEFNFDKIFSLCFDKHHAADMKREHLVSLGKYGLDFGTVGKKKTKPCYKLPYIEESDPCVEVEVESLKKFFNENLKG